MKLYQLVAHGEKARFDGTHKISSRYIFRSPGEAERAKSTFREVVITPINEYDMFALQDDDNLKIFIVELELK